MFRQPSNKNKKCDMYFTQARNRQAIVLITHTYSSISFFITILKFSRGIKRGYMCVWKSAEDYAIDVCL